MILTSLHVDGTACLSCQMPPAPVSSNGPGWNVPMTAGILSKSTITIAVRMLPMTAWFATPGIGIRFTSSPCHGSRCSVGQYVAGIGDCEV